MAGSIWQRNIDVDKDGNATITGNLTVEGTTTTIESTNTVIADKLIELGNGTSGTPSGDAGVIVERGSSTNAGLIWDESADEWVVCTTSATGGSSGDLTLTDANLSCADLTMSGLLTVSGNTDGAHTALVLKNEDDTADANGSVILRFDLEDTGGTAVDSGSIRVKKLNSFTSTANTQDAKMDFFLTEDGTLTRQGAFVGSNEFRFGNRNAKLNVDASSGTNAAGKSLTVRGGAGTGSGAGGSIIFQTADGGGSGSSVNSHVTALTIADDLSATFAGAIQANSTVTVGANDQGYDVILYGDTASANVMWDTSTDDLIFSGVAACVIPEGQLVLGSTAMTSTSAELNLLDAMPRGNLIYGNASAATARLAPGGANQVLTSDGTDIAWQDAAGGAAADDSNTILHMQVFA